MVTELLPYIEKGMSGEIIMTLTGELVLGILSSEGLKTSNPRHSPALEVGRTKELQ